MSHTIGQTTEDDRNISANQTELPLEDNVSLLSDADYEFLFNQLLEGVAHGWHDRRIIKFFNQLGDRANQSDWIAWLERLRPKIITLPIQSKRQLGTIMIRLGELIQSAPQIGQIGKVSNRIGRELLFGNTGDIIWEYVGPDLILDTSAQELEAESAFSPQLSENLAELATEATINVTEKQSMAVASTTTESTDVDRSDSNLVEDELPLLELDYLEEISANDLPESYTDSSPSETASDLVESRDKLKSDEEDFVRDTPKKIADPSRSESIFEREKQLDSTELSHDRAFDLNLESNSDLSEKESDLYPIAIDPEVMNSTKESERLDLGVSQKLNISSVNLAHSSPADLDRSSIELIEGWFNLGLKQVSGGEFDKAIVSWEKALSINPNLSEAWHNRGSALGRLGKYNEAVESFQKALEIDSNNYQAWNDRAHALYQLEKWAAAADSWGNAIKITPANHVFWYNRGCALEQLESWAESISSYEKSLEIKPDFQPARSRYTNLIADNSR